MGIITGTNYVSQYSGDEIDAALTAATNAKAVDGVLEGAGDGTFSARNVDASPTMGSDALVESGGVYTALQGKQDALTFDNAPVEGSVNPVKSGGIYTSVEELRGLIYDLMPRKTLPSAPIHAFADGADGIPIKAMSVAVEAVQSGSGDPSPDNVRPISGWSEAHIVDTGVNVWDEEWEQGIYDNTTGAKVGSNTRIRCKNPIPVKPNTTYYTVVPTGGSLNMYYYDVNGTFIGRYLVTSNNLFTTPSNCYYVTFFVGALTLTTYNNDVSINYPSTDTSYHAYNGSLVTIAFGSTVYGGTLTYKGGLEWEFTATHAIVDLGDLSWNTRYTGSVNKTLSATIGVTYAINDTGFVAEQYEYAGDISSVSYLDNPDSKGVTIYGYNGNSGDYFYAYIVLPTADSPAGNLLVKLATPLAPITLTADAETVTQYGDNVMFADCGDSTLTYRQDIGLLLGGE